MHLAMARSFVVPLDHRLDHTSPTQPQEDLVQDRVLALRLPDGSQFRIDRPLQIGQSSSNDVVLRDPKVSRRHCLLEPLGSRVRVCDLGSTNGTFVNGARVGEAEVSVGAVLLIGDLLLSVIDLKETSALRSLLVGESLAMVHLRREIERIGPKSLSVLIRGETGTGKELIAEAIHRVSGRKGAFVAVNCATLPRELIESELFGHEKGAFTGAAARRVGLFEEADGGTLFLDEIGELPIELQSRLLRALETRRIRPVGGNREIPIDVRVVSATHTPLPPTEFRQDLFYRINGCELRSPPLRERLEDLPLLAEHLLRRCFPTTHYRVKPDAVVRLRQHAWPGNVRELRNVLEQAAAFSSSTEITAEALRLVNGLKAAGAAPQKTLADLERQALVEALGRAGGSRRQAARDLSMPKSTFCDKLQKYNIK